MKYTFSFFIIFCSILIYSSIKHDSGVVGTTKLNGEGCSCHSPEADSAVSVWISGQDTLQIGQSAVYTIHLTGGPKIKGGYNAAARFGTLSVIDTFSQIIDLELTHKSPKQFPANDTLTWQFHYNAPTTSGTDTIYSVAQSVNGDEIPSDEDKWNFGNNLVVTVVPPVKVETEPTISSMGFELMQNHPNPFNPSTKIKYAIETPPSSSPLVKGRNEVGFVSLKVYDALGSEVATLVNEYKPSGSYEVEFSANGGLTSGIYYYRLEVANYSQTRKMVLIL